MSPLSADPARAPDQTRWFVEEVQPHEPALRAFLRARFPALTETDDVVQESYVRLLRAHAANRITNAKSLLFTTARNLALDLFRRKQVIAIEPIEVSGRSSVLVSGEDLVEDVCHDQEIGILQDAISALPPRCREVLALRKLHGLSREEIGRRMGISGGTVNAQIAIGMLRCRQYFQERGLLTPSTDAAEDAKS